MPAVFTDLIDLSQPFALIAKGERVTCYQGAIHTLNSLADIHRLGLATGCDIVFALPYRIIRERGFEARGDEPILAIAAQAALTLDKQAFLGQLPDTEVKLDGEITPSIADDAYAEIVRQFQINEIGGGNTSQTTISRRFSGRISNLDNTVLLSMYRRLLQSRGAYMTVLFGNVGAAGEAQYLIGATPERHLEIIGNETIMVPIAGTLRKEDRATFPQRLQAFLSDRKEINELFQVVDEEMKMMGVIAPEGGDIRGPFLREIGAVVHTEYELVGKRCINSIDALRHTLHAPTVVGSPMQSAARIIAQYEPDSRRYYAGEIGVYKAPRSADHSGDLDTAILIRSAELFGDGRFHIQAGGGLVRDSDPLSEAHESRAKAMGMMGIIMGASITSDEYLTLELHAAHRALLESRNEALSGFWTVRQNPYRPQGHDFAGCKITIVNNEDDFAHMIGHMVKFSQAQTDVIDTFAFDAATDKSDIVILGPGPGDPTDMKHPRMKRLQDIVATLKAKGKPMLGVCLGHQAIAFSEGLAVEKQETATQGMQRSVTVFGRDQLLGFYNSFSPVHTAIAASRNDLLLDLDENRRIIAMKGPGFIGFQFHPESVMSENGNELLLDALLELRQRAAV